MTHDEICSFLRKVRICKKLRQSDVCRIARRIDGYGISEASLCGYETQRNIPTIRSAVSWADALGYELVLVPKVTDTAVQPLRKG